MLCIRLNFVIDLKAICAQQALCDIDGRYGLWSKEHSKKVYTMMFWQEFHINIVSRTN